MVSTQLALSMQLVTSQSMSRGQIAADTTVSASVATTDAAGNPGSALIQRRTQSIPLFQSQPSL
ncbi:hypothetical protein [Sulfurimonas sp. HSL3-7]|uniref:hypothetical protein n=1 Tax=Sulfonitrofixus jiaomeiensis TaxID=3131938 RepID=UPI0031F98404